MPGASRYFIDFVPDSLPGEQDAALVATAGGTGSVYATFITVGGAVGTMQEGERIRWYNPSLEDFEWRASPKSDDEALSLLEGSPYSPTCRETYQEWRKLGASITVALIRAGEAAKEADERRRDEEA